MRKTLIGTVIKKASTNTLKVKVSRSVTHPIYKKKYTLSKNYLVHVLDDKYQVGDTVKIAETRPISKNKRFEVI